MCSVTGATFRQLDYWDRTGILAPAMATANGSGSRRRYSINQAYTIAVATRLVNMTSDRRGASMALDAIAPLVRRIEDKPPSGRMNWWIGSVGFCIDFDAIRAEVDAELSEAGILAAPTPV